MHAPRRWPCDRRLTAGGQPHERMVSKQGATLGWLLAGSTRTPNSRQQQGSMAQTDVACGTRRPAATLSPWGEREAAAAVLLPTPHDKNTDTLKCVAEWRPQTAQQRATGRHMAWAVCEMGHGPAAAAAARPCQAPPWQVPRMHGARLPQQPPAAAAGACPSNAPTCCWGRIKRGGDDDDRHAMRPALHMEVQPARQSLPCTNVKSCTHESAAYHAPTNSAAMAVLSSAAGQRGTCFARAGGHAAGATQTPLHAACAAERCPRAHRCFTWQPDAMGGQWRAD